MITTAADVVQTPDAAAPARPGADALTVTLRPRTDGDWRDGPPAEIRWWAALKRLYRDYGLIAEWAEPSPCAVCPLTQAAKGRGGRE